MRRGWQTKRLGDFALAVSTGPFGSILHKSDYVDDGVPLVNPINIVGESIVPDPSKLISDVTKRRLSNYVLEAGDVVVGRRGEIGRCAVVGPKEKGWICGTGSFFIRPSPSLDSQFLAHLIRSAGYREKLEQLSTGTTMKNLSNTALGDLVISAPPLPEQQRIVRILDEAFERIALARANAEKNHQNARALFESHLQSAFSEQLGGRHHQVPLSSILAEQPRNGWSPPAEFQTGTGIPVLTLSAVTGFEYDGSRVKMSSAPTRAGAHYWLQDGELLITRSNTQELVGHVAIYDGNPSKAICCDLIMKMKVNPSRALTRFVYYFLRSPVARAYLMEKAHGASSTMKKIGKQVVQNVMVPHLPLSSQQSIVAILDALSGYTHHLTTLYQRKLAALDELKKSLLHQAFSGQL